MNDKPITVLLHGLGQNETIMAPLERALVEADFDVYNLAYPSKSYPVAKLSHLVVERIEHGFKNRSVNFVTHSLGSIIVRYINQHKLLNHINRVVMLAPPNEGTPIITKLKRFKWFQNYWGPASVELSDDTSGIHHSLTDPINFECGIIAGNKTVDPWFSWWLLEGEDDGKVSVESTKLEEMSDHTIVPVAHPHMPRHPDVIKKTIYFLTHGKFDKNSLGT